MGKKSKDSDGLVFSTNKNPGNSFFDFLKEDDETQSENADQVLRVQMERKGRGGKTVTIIRGFEGSDQDLKELAKSIKSHCGTGGSAKDGEIIIQGDLKQKIISFLKTQGYSDVK